MSVRFPPWWWRSTSFNCRTRMFCGKNCRSCPACRKSKKLQEVARMPNLSQIKRQRMLDSLAHIKEEHKQGWRCHAHRSRWNRKWTERQKVRPRLGEAWRSWAITKETFEYSNISMFLSIIINRCSYLTKKLYKPWLINFEEKMVYNHLKQCQIEARGIIWILFNGVTITTDF